MKIDESKFIKGFNAGYLLAVHEASLITNLLKNVQPTTSYISGIKSGQKEFQFEIDKNQLEELRSIRDQKDHSRDLE